jgi:ABC-type transport system involved in cytochrome c biogenesis permease subunit
VRVVFEFYQLAAAFYLAAALAAALGYTLPSARLSRAAVAGLALGVVVHAVAFWQLHEGEQTPPLTDLAYVIPFVVWMATLFYLLLLIRVRLVGLAVVVAPLAFIGTFVEFLGAPAAEPGAETSSPIWSHVHVLLASAGLALLAVAGVAGALYLMRHRTIKAKRRSAARFSLPSLEALDRVNALSLVVSFLLLSLGVVTGVLWTQAVDGRWWPGTPHANATLAAWLVLAVLVTARFGAGQGARRSALGSMAGFALMLIAVIGVGMLV